MTVNKGSPGLARGESGAYEKTGIANDEDLDEHRRSLGLGVRPGSIFGVCVRNAAVDLSVASEDSPDDQTADIQPIVPPAFCHRSLEIDRLEIRILSLVASRLASLTDISRD